MGTLNTIKFLQELGACSVYDLVEQAAKKSINKASGKTRIMLKGEELQALGLEHGFGNLKHPRLIIAGNNSKKGQAVWGATVCDASGQPIQSVTLGYDITRGKNPICQSRKEVYDGKKKIYSKSEYIDSNKKPTDNTEIHTSVSRNGGLTTVNADAADMYHYSAKVPSEKKASDFYARTGLGIPGSASVKSEIAALAKQQELKFRIEWIADTFKSTPIIQQKMSKVSKMDFKAVEKEMSLQQANMKKMEEEFDKLYAEIFGTSEKAPNWKENFYVQNVPEINPVTGKALSKQTIQKLHKKMQKYQETRMLLMNLTDRKQILSGFGKLDEVYLSKMFDYLGVTFGKSMDEAMAKELRALKGLPKTEILEKAKDIICKKVGLPSKLIKISPAPKDYEIGPMSAAFEESQACLYYHPTVLNAPDDALIAAIRHELDHFEVLAKVAKSMGLQDYKTLVCKDDKKIAMFDEQTWAKVLEHINAEGFNPEPYIKCMQEYVIPFGSFKNTIKYFANPLEGRAYQAGLEAELAVNGGNIAIQNSNQLIISKICTKLQSSLDELQKISGKDFDIDSYLSKLRTCALNMVENPASPHYPTEVFEKSLKVVERDLAKARIQAQKSGSSVITTTIEPRKSTKVSLKYVKLLQERNVVKVD